MSMCEYGQLLLVILSSALPTTPINSGSMGISAGAVGYGSWLEASALAWASVLLNHRVYTQTQIRTLPITALMPTLVVTLVSEHKN